MRLEKRLWIRKKTPVKGSSLSRAPRFCNFYSRVTNSITKPDSIKAGISVTQSDSAQPTTLHLTLTCNSPATTNPVTFLSHYPSMDLSHSLFLLNSSLDRHLNTDHYGQLELEERANFSRSRRAIERFDEQLQRESAKEQEAKSA